MTNPGIPPVLSKRNHEEAVDRIQSLKDEIDNLLDDVDAALESVPAPGQPITVTAA